MDCVNLAAWIDRSQTASGGVTVQTSQSIHSVLGSKGADAPAEGDILPHLWHWYAFPPTVPMYDLGVDGHPRTGDFMPPLRFNRRMWAGGSVEFITPLHVGEPLTKRTRIANISEKTGAAGDMVVVSLDHEIHGQDGLAVLERQNIVYLQIPKAYMPPKATPAPAHADIAHPVEITPPLLFRYSAITFNAHRIHYDLPYTQQVEHYPDLLVHGPLQAQLLLNLATASRGMAPKVFTYRGVHPLFAGDALSVQAIKETTAEWKLCAVASGSHQTMQASAMWEI